MEAPEFSSEAVSETFSHHPAAMREKLLELRSHIFAVAGETDGVGQLEETLKWNEAAYLTHKPKSGTTIRINAHKGSDTEIGLYVPCQTDLIDRYRTLYADCLKFEGNRAIVFDSRKPFPVEPVRHCIAMALTYHLK